jgi:NADH-quinone oxidoreductase subunit E
MMTATEKQNMDLRKLNRILSRYKGDSNAVISVLQDVQEEFGWVPPECIEHVADALKVFPSKIYGVVTFYAQFHMKPRGRNIITSCSGTACHVKGSRNIINAVRRELSLEENEETTSDLKFTFETLNCVGACGIAPVTIINNKVHGKSTSRKILSEIKSLYENGGKS